MKARAPQRYCISELLCGERKNIKNIPYNHSMAPVKPRTGSSKSGQKGGKKPSGNGSTSKPKRKPGASQPATQVKTKPASAPPKKKQRIYTDKELGIPKLNMITPAGVQKPKGKKKGKVFVDDQESMMTILAMVNADKEGQIESKMMKAVSSRARCHPVGLLRLTTFPSPSDKWRRSERHAGKRQKHVKTRSGRNL